MGKFYEAQGLPRYTVSHNGNNGVIFPIKTYGILIIQQLDTKTWLATKIILRTSKIRLHSHFESTIFELKYLSN